MGMISVGLGISKKYTVKKIPTAVRFQAQMNPLINSDDLRSDHVTDHG